MTRNFSFCSCSLLSIIQGVFALDFRAIFIPTIPTIQWSTSMRKTLSLIKIRCSDRLWLLRWHEGLGSQPYETPAHNCRAVTCVQHCSPLDWTVAKMHDNTCCNIKEDIVQPLAFLSFGPGFSILIRWPRHLIEQNRL